MGKSGKNTLALIGLDIEGEWNIPLLQNAAEMSGASLRFVGTSLLPNSQSPARSIADILHSYDQVLACETSEKSRSVYAFPAPRGSTAVVVGNELTGLPKNVLTRVDQVVSIPMFGKGMSSVNVAVAAAIALYALERDLGRTCIKRSKLGHRDVDILLQSPENPSELGSLLRSVWAFGWRKVYLCDQQGVWFTKDKHLIMAGRAAARREINRLVIAPDKQMNTQKYDKLIICNDDRVGTALSRFALPNHGKVVVSYGAEEPHFSKDMPIEWVYVDHCNSKVKPSYRHMGSILLSVISQMLLRGKRG